MSLQIPTTEELKNSIIAKFEAYFGGTVPVFVSSFLRVCSAVLAGMLTILYKYSGFIFLQLFVQYASDKETTINGKRVIPLVEWGRLVGAGDPTAATRAELTIDVTVTNQTGSLASNSQLVNVGNGVTYLTTSAVALDADVVQANIRAYRDQNDGGGKGIIGNLAIGDTVTFINPIANVASDATVSAIVVTAADAESTEAYRQRVIDRFRSQPQGGAYIDYEIWGEAVEGIINVYPYTGDPGIVNVYSEATIESCGNDDGIPTVDQLVDVYDAIQLDDAGLASLRPVGSLVYSLPITRTGFNVVVVGLEGGSDQAQLETKTEEALVQYFWSRAPFIPGLTLGKRKDRITKAAISGAVQDVCDAFGAVFDGVIVSVDGGGQFDTYNLGEGEKAKAVTISF